MLASAVARVCARSIIENRELDFLSDSIFLTASSTFMDSYVFAGLCSRDFCINSFGDSLMWNAYFSSCKMFSFHIKILMMHKFGRIEIEHFHPRAPDSWGIINTLVLIVSR